MRLLRIQNDVVSLVERIGNNIPPYGILSHTWGEDGDEVTYKDIIKGTGKAKEGYQKILWCGRQAARDNLDHFWVDTCCIDKSSSAELAEALNSMFRWYKNSKKCYVFLADVHYTALKGWRPAFRKSRWFTRGWTLQELIAPISVEFFSVDGIRLGDKHSLEQTLHEITGIDIKALQGLPLAYFSIAERMSWAKNRETKREEDAAYSLLGLFNVYMPLIYGEGRKKAIVRLQKEIKESLGSVTKQLDERQRETLLDSLRFDQMYARWMTIKPAHAETCRWILQDSRYIDWLDKSKMDTHGGFFWIKGKPGTGKSTLMKYILSHTSMTETKSITISFFFNGRGEDLEKSTLGAYRSLLLQLIEHLPTIGSVLNSLHLSKPTVKQSYRWSVEVLELLIERAVGLIGNTSVICFIDALDECDEWQVRSMISFVERIGEVARSSRTRFLVCLSSRHYPSISIGNGMSLILEGQVGHSQDITKYLESDLRIGRSEIANQIRQDAQEKASGIFMWAALVVAILNREYDSGRLHALRRRLQEIPNDLHELFREVLTRDDENNDDLILSLQWVLFSKQPLRPRELYFAVLSGLQVELEPIYFSDKKDDINETEEVIRRYILSASKGLIEITDADIPTTQFIHESVKDFLLKRDGIGRTWPELGSNLLGQSHDVLKRCCFKFINDKSLSQYETIEWDWYGQMVAKYTTPFAAYAIANVLYHADMAAANGIDQTKFVSALSNNITEWNLERFYGYRIHVFAWQNRTNLVKYLPSPLAYFGEPGDESTDTPIFKALSNGNPEIVIAFVEIHAASLSPTTLLYKCCMQYCKDGEKPDRPEKNHLSFSRDSILSYLAAFGDELLFELALHTNKFQVDIEHSHDGKTPFLRAVVHGNMAIVKLLLETGNVNVNVTDHVSGRTALIWAVMHGNSTMVRLLLDTGKVDVNVRDASLGRAALIWALESRHEPTVQLLLDQSSTNCNLGDTVYGRTPLFWAIQQPGREGLVRILLQKDGIEVDSPDRTGRTPLSWAAEYGHETVCRLLLETGKVNACSKDQDGQTPEMWAKKWSMHDKRRNDSIVELLRSHQSV